MHSLADLESPSHQLLLISLISLCWAVQRGRGGLPCKVDIFGEVSKWFKPGFHPLCLLAHKGKTHLATPTVSSFTAALHPSLSLTCPHGSFSQLSTCILQVASSGIPLSSYSSQTPGPLVNSLIPHPGCSLEWSYKFLKFNMHQAKDWKATPPICRHKWFP